jgi:hypothetical protein
MISDLFIGGGFAVDPAGEWIATSTALIFIRCGPDALPKA